MKIRIWVLFGLLTVVAFGSGNELKAQYRSQSRMANLGLHSFDSVASIGSSTAMRIDDNPIDDGGGDGGGGGGEDDDGPVFISGVLPCPSIILNQGLWGQWRQAGATDLCGMLDGSWLFIEESVISRIHDRLENTVRKRRWSPNLRGFYNIDIDLANYRTAKKRVNIGPDNHKMRLSWTLPDNCISCTANLNNWPNRNVAILFDITLDVVIEATGNLADPVEVKSTVLSFRHTRCWNDGTIKKRSFNSEVEKDFDATSETVPVSVPRKFFGSLSEDLAAQVLPSTYDLQFDYISAESRLVFRLYNTFLKIPTYHGVFKYRR